MTLEKTGHTAVPTGTQTIDPAPSALRIDGRRPREHGDRGVATATRRHPRLSWETDTARRIAFEVTVDDATGSVVWRSGRVESTDSAVIVSATLSPFAHYRWTVRVQMADGRWSHPAVSAFETGPTTLADWSGPWVSAPARSRVRTTFSVVGDVERARLHLTGQGLVRAELNSSPVNADHLDPTRTDTDRALYRSYDVDDLVRVGVNELDVVLGIGEWGRSALDPRALIELVLDHTDGSRSRIVPDTGSIVSSSRIAVDDPFYVERHDVSAEVAAEWFPIAPEQLLGTSPGGPSDSAPRLPRVVEPDPTPPARVVSRIVPIELSSRPGARLFDLGTNIAGRSRVIMHDAVAAGVVVRVVHGEHVGADGRLDTTNLMMPFDAGRVRQVVDWVATGEAGDVIEAWFAYHGFRYLEVQGLPDHVAIEVTAGVLHTDLAPSGVLRTDNPTIETLLARAERTLLNNVHGVPEDCPTREQAAWTGDTASVAEYELAAFDTETFLGKWIRDLLTSQEPNGGLPAISPDVRSPRLPADPVWGAALHRLMLGHWLHYGDAQLILDALPGLRRWAAFQLSCTDELGVIGASPISYGHDWLALEQTPPPVHHTAATIDCLLALARLEQDVGDASAAARWTGHADRLRIAARAHFFDETTGVFANGSQGAYAAAIDAGILTGVEADDAAARIEADVRARGNRLSGGFATTRTIVRALAAAGRSQLVADMLEQPAEPGIGAMLTSGPGTFWECWWIDPTNTGTGSLDHVGLGGVFAAWAWESLAGLRPTSAGYRTFEIEPQFVDGVDELHVETRTAAGLVRFGYRIIDGTAELEVSVPVGATATLAGEELHGGLHLVQMPVTRDARVVPPVERTPFSAPPIAPGARDVTGRRDLLTVALTDGTLQAAVTSEIIVIERLNCMPIPHAQPAGAVAEVVARHDGVLPSARITFPQPLDASDATFFYAMLDLCDEGAARGARPTIRLVSADGSELVSVGISWPAGWNRVAVDTTDWAGRSAVTAVEVSLLRPADDAEDLLMPQAAESPGGFHLGEVGLSTVRRNW